MSVDFTAKCAHICVVGSDDLLRRSAIDKLLQKFLSWKLVLFVPVSSLVSTEICPHSMKSTLHKNHQKVKKKKKKRSVEVKKGYKGIFIKIISNQFSVPSDDPFHVASKINCCKSIFFSIVVSTYPWFRFPKFQLL